MPLERVRSFDIWYWSKCGSVEVTKQRILATNMLKALQIFERRITKEHPNMSFEFEAYPADTQGIGVIHTKERT